MAKVSRKSARLALLAEEDLYVIYAYTAQQWGDNQAENYRGFLATAMQTLADNPEAALLVPNSKNTRVYAVRWKNSRQGHRIYFRETDDGISVLRVLHTSRIWSENL